jgi:DNA-binding NtrC family response regulator
LIFLVEFGLYPTMNSKDLKILFVEDDDFSMRVTKRTLARYGEVVAVGSLEDALAYLGRYKFDVAFFDLNLHGKLDGLTLVKKAQELGLYSIVISGEDEGAIIEKAYRNGAIDYISKPFSDDKFNQVIERFFNTRKHLDFENVINKKFITKSEKQLNELNKIKNLTVSQKPIFISGETGTGKRVVAHIIKEICAPENYIEVNCSQYSEELITSELFGHKKGSFTGATQDKVGLLEKAHNGIIFLDEIHALSLKSQKTLLKAIEEKEFYPVGSDKLIKSNFRVISATCENIAELIDQSKFREDLYARIATFKINLFPLRERIEDIDLLFQYYIQKSMIQIYINDVAKNILRQYAWPRNTREIEDLVENWLVNGERLITPESIPSHIRYNINHQTKFIPDHYLDMVEEHGLSDFLKFFKKEICLEIIKRNDNNLRQSAEKMAIAHSQLSTYLKQNKNFSLHEGRIS